MTMNKLIQPNRSAVNDDVRPAIHSSPDVIIQRIDELSSEQLYVINLEDDSGREFYIAEDQALISLSEPVASAPFLIKTYKELTTQLNQLRKNYPVSCRIYGIEFGEFNNRRIQLQTNLTSNLSQERCRQNKLL